MPQSGYLFICNGDLDRFKSGVITNKTATKFMYKFLCGHMFSFLLGELARDGVPGSYDRNMFYYLINCQTVFQSIPSDIPTSIV